MGKKNKKEYETQREIEEERERGRELKEKVLKQRVYFRSNLKYYSAAGIRAEDAAAHTHTHTHPSERQTYLHIIDPFIDSIHHEEGVV